MRIQLMTAIETRILGFSKRSPQNVFCRFLASQSPVFMMEPTGTLPPQGDEAGWLITQGIWHPFSHVAWQVLKAWDVL
jgi:hypothetical protein